MEKYYIMIDGQQKGPFTKQEIINNGFSQECYVYNKNIGDWKKISEIPGFYTQTLTPTPTPYYNTGTTTKNPHPQPPLYQPTNSLPKTWLVESILVTLFCCLPLGIAGIVNAAKVESRFNSGDYNGAKEASDDAKKWVSWSFGLGIVIIIIYFIAGVAGS